MAVTEISRRQGIHSRRAVVQANPKTVLSDGRASQGYVDPKFPNPHGEWDTPIIIYGYTPSLALAAVAAVWFFLLTALHTMQTIRYKSWWWTPVSVGLTFEIVGYVARSLSAKKDSYNLIFFILNYFFIVTAPVFLAAGVYTTLWVLINRLGRKYSVLPPKAVLWFFISSDIVATGLQVAGAAMIGKAESVHKDPTTPNDILLGGLASQVFSIGMFIIVAGSFVFRARNSIRESNLGVLIVVFAAATLLIYLRTAFRLAETAGGLFSDLQTHEAYFAALEFVPIAVALLLLGIWHPGKCVGGKVTESSTE